MLDKEKLTITASSMQHMTKEQKEQFLKDERRKNYLKNKRLKKLTKKAQKGTKKKKYKVKLV